MAILNSSMFRGARKQAGGWVLYKVGGQTIAREVASQVSNPRTPAQMDNRVRLQNVVSVYRANRGWMKGAFENKKQKESDYNAFVSANLSRSQVAFTKQQAAAGAAVAAPYQISSGSLGSIEQQVSESELQTNIYLGELSMTSSTTVGQFASAVISNNNNLVQGMQLSLILNIQSVNQATGIPYIITRAYEVVLDPTNTELLSAYFPDELLASGGGTDNILYADLSKQGSGAASFILSHTVAATTRVSEQSMLMYGSLEVYNSYTSAAAIAEAVTSYGENEVNFLDSNSAAGQTDVPISNGIAFIIISSIIVRADETFRGVLAENSTKTIAMLQPIAAGAAVTATLYNRSTSDTYVLTGIVVSADRMSVTWRPPQTISVEELQNFEIVMYADSERYAFPFKLAPAN